ncbi:MAG: DUF3306 domain-containing protein [Burkholderiales bacterium]|nr:MAG: DUF3306 domain-containing protein [Burkholderiales bacterium]
MALDKSFSDDSGFLSRWSQRKQALRKGEALAEPEKPKIEAVLDQKPVIAGINTAQSAPDLVVSQEPVQQEIKPPAPTMQDVHQLTPQSDFKPFMRTDVAPEVKNAAMKQLFKDPHFNVMDMMDTYVDDYSKPDPLPPEMLRKMAVTQFLGFWKEEEEAEEKAAAEKKAREDAGEAAAENVAQSEPENIAPETTLESQASIAEAVATPHDHPDLQLQPDDAARRESARPSAG